MSTIIDKVLDYLNIKVTPFAKKIGAHPTQIFDLKSGKTKNITPAMAEKINAVYPCFNRLWLLTGEGEMLKYQSTARVVGDAYSPSSVDENIVMVDYIPGVATATFIEYMGSGNPSFDKIPVPKQHGENYDDTYKVFEVIGESMTPRIPNRAKILTKECPKQKWESVDGVVVVVFEDEIVVKRIINNDLATKNCLVLSSDNPLYGERRIALADIRAIYKALRIISAEIV